MVSSQRSGRGTLGHLGGEKEERKRGKKGGGRRKKGGKKGGKKRGKNEKKRSFNLSLQAFEAAVAVAAEAANIMSTFKSVIHNFILRHSLKYGVLK